MDGASLFLAAMLSSDFSYILIFPEGRYKLVVGEMMNDE